MDEKDRQGLFGFLFSSMKHNIRQYTMVLALMFVWILFTFATNFVFIGSRNLSLLFLQCATTAILAIGMTLVIVTGHIDLSVGAFAGFVGAVTAVMQVKINWGPMPEWSVTILTIAMALLIGLIIGAWQGFWIAYQKVPAFIVTLSTMIILKGAILIVSGGATIGPMNPSFKVIGQGYLPRMFITNELVFKAGLTRESSVQYANILQGNLLTLPTNSGKLSAYFLKRAPVVTVERYENKSEISTNNAAIYTLTNLAAGVFVTVETNKSTVNWLTNTRVVALETNAADKTAVVTIKTTGTGVRHYIVLFNDTTLYLTIITIFVFVIFEIRKRNTRKKYGFEVTPLRFEILIMVLLSAVIAAVGSIMIFYQGIPYAILIVLALVFLFSFIANNTTYGRHLYAIGGNAEAARLSGINIKMKTFVLFMVMGVISALAGLVYTARLNSASTSAGNLFELDAIAASVIGGTSLMGGEGTIFGAIIGALFMESISNGTSLLNLPQELQNIIKGAILLLAVWIDIATRKKSS